MSNPNFPLSKTEKALYATVVPDSYDGYDDCSGVERGDEYSSKEHFEDSAGSVVETPDHCAPDVSKAVELLSNDASIPLDETLLRIWLPMLFKEHKDAALTGSMIDASVSGDVKFSPHVPLDESLMRIWVPMLFKDSIKAE